MSLENFGTFLGTGIRESPSALDLLLLGFLEVDKKFLLEDLDFLGRVAIFGGGEYQLTKVDDRGGILLPLKVVVSVFEEAGARWK